MDFMMDLKEKKTKDLIAIYETAILQFGIIPVLQILKDAEDCENFESCEIIKKSIEDLNRMCGGTMPTTIADVNINLIKNAFDQYGGVGSGDNYINEIKKYKTEADKFISRNIAIYELNLKIQK